MNGTQRSQFTTRCDFEKYGSRCLRLAGVEGFLLSLGAGAEQHHDLKVLARSSLQQTEFANAHISGHREEDIHSLKRAKE